jgi:hypothetical protein
MFRKLTLLLSSGKKGGKGVAPTLWGPLERGSLNHWIETERLRLALSKRSHRIGAPPLLPEDGSKASFRNIVFKRKKNIVRWIETKSKVLR